MKLMNKLSQKSLKIIIKNKIYN